MEDMIRNIRENAPDHKIIKDMIDEHRQEQLKSARKYQEYLGEVPIDKRDPKDPNKIDNRLKNDYRGMIVDTIVGYMFGEHVSYSLDPRQYSRQAYERNSELLQSFVTRNNLADLDSQTGKMSSIAGYTGRLLYHDRQGKEKAVLVPPWECIFIDDESKYEAQYAVRYYPVLVETSDGMKKRTKVEMYDDLHVYIYQEQPNGRYEQIEQRTHMYQRIPLIQFKNNQELQGDFDKVAELIDAYDRTLSDVQNEVEEFRNAYMVFAGCEIDEEFLNQARQTGAIQLPEGANVQYLTKDLSPEFFEQHKRTLRDNIIQFARTVDFQDEKFSGSSQSGEARKWKLLSLENKAVQKERKFSEALYQMFECLCTAWQTRGYNIDPEHISYEFARNLPADLSHEAEVQGMLKGKVSERTRLSQLSFIADVDAEIEEMQEEQEAQNQALPGS